MSPQTNSPDVVKISIEVTPLEGRFLRFDSFVDGERRASVTEDSPFNYVLRERSAAKRIVSA